VGAANLAAGLQDAYLSRSPVIAITGAHASSKKLRNSYQEIDDHRSLFAPVTKFNASINTTAELPQAIRQAFREAVSGTPRPVHIDVTNHIGLIIDTGEAVCDIYSEPRFAKAPAFRPMPDQEDVRAAAALLYKAQRPVIIVGGGALMSDAGAEILQLVERLGIPLGTSVDGKGIIPDTHPLCMGCVGGYGRKVANTLLAEADLVLYIGCKACDQVSQDWKLPAPGTDVIQIDINPAELGRNYPNAASLLGDAKACVAALVREMPNRHGNESWGAKATAALQKWRDPLRTA
jgi:acetolactate synthase-1/2/3 large subunit